MFYPNQIRMKYYRNFTIYIQYLGFQKLEKKNIYNLSEANAFMD